MSERTTGMAPAPKLPAVAVAVEDERLADDVVAHFAPEARGDVQAYEDPRYLVQGDKVIAADVTIVSFHVLKNLARHHADAVADFCRRHRVVLLVRSQEFLDAVAYLELVDGVVFEDATMHRLQDVITLSGSGYSILPAGAAMDIVTDRLRCDTIERLTALELSILDQVRLAKTNRAIARSLGLTEANVKTKVRAILKALKFQNRTEAAVFAARQQETIRRAMTARAEQGIQPGHDEVELESDAELDVSDEGDDSDLTH